MFSKFPGLPLVTSAATIKETASRLKHAPKERQNGACGHTPFCFLPRGGSGGGIKAPGGGKSAANDSAHRDR
jgi:hypothetical protein